MTVRTADLSVSTEHKGAIPYVSAQRRGQWAVGFLLLSTLLALAMLISELFQIGFLAKVSAGQIVTEAAAASNDIRQQTITVLYLLAVIVTSVFFLRWIHRAYRNLNAFGVQGLKYSPGWAVGNFFVPFLNLVRPFQVIREMWQASSANLARGDLSWREESVTPLIGWWWGSWLAGGFLGRMSTNLIEGAKALDQIVLGAWIGAASSVLVIMAGVAVVLVIRGIDLKQEGQNRCLASADASASDLSGLPPYSDYRKIGSLPLMVAGIGFAVSVLVMLLATHFTPSQYEAGSLTKIGGGFLRGNTYASPQFRFSVEIPHGWQVRDTDFKMGIENAVLELTTTGASFVLLRSEGKLTTEEYAAQVKGGLRQMGEILGEIHTTEATIANAPAAIHTFEAREEGATYSYEAVCFATGAAHYCGFSWCSASDRARLEHDFKRIVNSVRVLD